jgi:hypothetical protein
MAEKGYEYFISEPDTVKTMKCKVCDCFCTLTKNVVGATSFISAMAGSKVCHDQWICPYYKEEWHQQALQALKFSEGAPPSIKKMALNDRDRIVTANLGDQ